MQNISDTDAEPRGDQARRIPVLLLPLILLTSYFYANNRQGGDLFLGMVVVLLLLAFLISLIELGRKFTNNERKRAALSKELEKSKAQITQLEGELGETKGKASQAETEVSQVKAELEALNAELLESNLAFDNHSLQLEVIAKDLEDAKQETDAILASVKQGIFLIDSAGSIGRQFSKELKSIFREEDFAFRKFFHLLKPLLPEKRCQTVSDYLRLLFNPRKNEQQLQRFNPLKCVELNFPHPSGGFESKTIEFSFQRIFSNETVRTVLVTAVDVTDRTNMEKRLKEGEERRERQLSLLLDLLHVESKLLRSFMADANATVEQVNCIFMGTSGEVQSATEISPRDKINHVFRIVHKLKSQAASLHLVIFEKAIHEMENVLNELRRNANVSNEDLLNVLVLLSNFQKKLDEASELVEKISGLRHSFGNVDADCAQATTPSTELMQAAEELCRTVADRSGKKARIEWQINGFDNLPATHHRVLRDATLQLVRNAVIHGIESPAVREGTGKNPCGRINIRIGLIENGQALRLSCADDGAGLDLEAIRNRAVSEGIITGEQATTLSQSSLCALIFEPGFSTASEVTEDAGRGVGLDAVRADISGQLGGEIQIEFGIGQSCTFELVVPLPHL